MFRRRMAVVERFESASAIDTIQLVATDPAHLPRMSARLTDLAPVMIIDSIDPKSFVRRGSTNRDQPPSER